MSSCHYRDPRVVAAYDRENGPEHDITRDDVPFYAGLAGNAAAAGHGVLELGCGTGRVTIPMARTGARVTGLERSPQMLAVATAKGTAEAVSGIEWVQADMAGFHLGARFGLVVIPFRSFQLLSTLDAQKSCVACIHEHLEPDGRLAFNVFNPDVLASLAGRTMDGRAQRAIERGEDGAVFTRSARRLRLRWVFRVEIELLLDQAGFVVEALHGWFDGRPFEGGSTEMVWLAKLKRPERRLESVAQPSIGSLYLENGKK